MAEIWSNSTCWSSVFLILSLIISSSIVIPDVRGGTDKKYLALSTYLRIWKKSVLVPAILFRILPGHRFFIVAGPRAKSCQAEFGRRRFNDRRRRGHLHPPTSPSNPIITIHQLHPRAQFLQGRGRFPCHLWIRRGMGAALGNAAPKFLFETGGVDLTSK